ncbi:hypothetical protein PITC_093630 [Penicillium italicum]|uniref:Uncharacterized protein n=1 Tax=Penicillium italicum TaxID=40296 RepID=A0A0A2KCP2_PENIT|nr:hypothetical protein PITC_093630 [Penicillium italicum]
MKASFITTIAALASSAFAAPTPVGNLDSHLDGLKVGDITNELNLYELPVVSKLGDVTEVLNLGPQVHTILTVVAPDTTTLVIELSPEVSSLVSGLDLGTTLGSIVASSAAGVDDLVSGLGPVVDGLVTVVGADVGALLISLSAEVADLVSGLGLSTIDVPVGVVVAILGKNLKRGEIVQDLAPIVKATVIVIGQDAKQLLIELSPSATSLLAGLGLTTIPGPIGSIVAEAASVGDLVKQISGPVEELLHIVGKDGKNLLIKLSPSVVALVTSLGLPTVATPLGAILTTVAQNL